MHVSSSTLPLQHFTPTSDPLRDPYTIKPKESQKRNPTEKCPDLSQKIQELLNPEKDTLTKIQAYGRLFFPKEKLALKELKCPDDGCAKNQSYKKLMQLKEHINREHIHYLRYSCLECNNKNFGAYDAARFHINRCHKNRVFRELLKDHYYSDLKLPMEAYHTTEEYSSEKSPQSNDSTPEYEFPFVQNNPPNAAPINDRDSPLSHWQGESEYEPIFLLTDESENGIPFD